MIKDFNYFKYKYKKGFTLLEIMFGLSILFIISSLTFFSFKEMNNKQVLQKQIDDIKLTLNEIRMNAINSKDINGNHSIIFSTTSISFSNKNKTFEKGVYLYDYSTATTTLIFNRLSGLPSASGTFYFKLEKEGEILSTSSIIINNLGIIE